MREAKRAAQNANVHKKSSPAGNELALVIPIYNEAANIKRVFSEWLPVLEAEGISFIIVAVNDGSTDGTLPILKDMERDERNHISVIDQPNSGHGPSCRAGYEAALKSDADWILQIDSDGQCDPQFFPDFWKARGEAEAVFGVRVSRGDGFIRQLISKACRISTYLVTGKDLVDPNVPFRLMKKKALTNALRRVPPNFQIQNVALTLALKREGGLRWAYVPIAFRERQGGRNSINLRSITRMGFRMLKELHRVGA